MLKIIHSADLHLDSPLSGLDPEKSALRRQELRQLPARLAQLVRAEKADLVLLPGDLFDGGRIRPETVRLLAQALEEMAVPVVIAPGNHDFVSHRSPYIGVSWPGNVHIFKTASMETADLPGLGCAVHGCAFTGPRRLDNPLAGISAAADGRTHLLCVHGEVGQTGDYGPIAPQSLAESGAAYAALGHIHRGSGLQSAGPVFWAYPGCPEGRGFDECGPKGALVVSVDGGGVTAEFAPLCLRQYRIEPVELEGGEPPDGARFDHSPDLVRLILRGERARPLDLAQLARRYAGRFFHLELRDETTLPKDLWDRSREDSLTGLFLREMKRRLEDAGEEGRPALLLATRMGLAALEGEEDIRP